MGKRIAALTLALLLCLGLAVPASAAGAFTDVPGTHWAAAQIEKAAADGIMTGTAPGVFSPNGKLTVAQWMVILTRTYFGDEVAASTATGEWYAKNYDVAMKHWLMGDVFQDEYLDSLMPVTMTKEMANGECSREQAAAMIANIIRAKNLSTFDMSSTPTMDELLAFKDKIPDLDKSAHYRRQDIATCYYYGIMSGIDSSGNFGGSSSMTRAQAAVLYCRMGEVIDKLTAEKNSLVNPTTPGQPVNPPKQENPTTPENPTQPENPTTPENPTQPENPSREEYIEEVVRLVNIERDKEGLPPLTVSTELQQAAQKKAQDMVDNNYFDHTSPTYGSPFKMLQDFGIGYYIAAENIAMGQATPESVMTTWMNSPGHRANILSECTQIGVGYAAPYWVQLFITPN